MKIASYTAIIGGKDEARLDIECFTEAKFSCPTRSARYYKWNPALVLPEHDVSIWLDGNVSLAISEERLIALALRNNDIAVFKHPGRDCVYSEAKAVIRHGLDDIDIVNFQMDRYRAEKYPTRNGLAETTMIIRRNTDNVNAFCEDVWREICGGSRRDQLAFNPVLRKHNLRVYYLKGDIRHHKWFNYKQHKF